MSAGQAVERLDARVEGYVQGVGFRWYVAREAARLRLVGWAANEPDGSLHVVLEGSAGALDEMLASLGHGPPAAEVRRVTSQRIAALGEFSGFKVRARSHHGD